MRAHPAKVSPDDTLAMLVDIFDLYQQVVLPVVDSNECVVGLVYDFDIAQLILGMVSRAELETVALVKARDVMRIQKPFAVDEMDEAAQGLKALNDAELPRIAVTRNGRLTGTIGRIDVCQALLTPGP